MSLLHINLRDVLLSENEQVQRRVVSARRQRHLRKIELDKLVVSPDDLRQLDYPADTDLQEALRLLGIKNSAREDVPEDRLPADRIVHFQAIRKICTDYGLIFRPFRAYKGQLAKEVAVEVLKLKGILQHAPVANRFFIAAPKEMFCDSLSPNDPFLFYEIGPDEYYLVHQWGMDTSPLRLITHWPRGTRVRLFATRSVLCLLAICGMAGVGIQSPAVQPWMFVGGAGVWGVWFRFLWDYKHKRGVHERRWFQP